MNNEEYVRKAIKRVAVMLTLKWVILFWMSRMFRRAAARAAKRAS